VLLSNRAVRVLERDTETRGRVYECVPPDGPVRLAGSAYDNTVQHDYSIGVIASAGTWVAVSYRSVVDFHGTELVEKVFDARSGRSYRFFEAGIPEGQGFEEVPAEGDWPERILINRFGELAVALAGPGTTEILAVRSNGRSRVLDNAPAAQIPLASLTLHGHLAAWTDAGAPRSATI
jgi:hypothetical protein